ncbi:MAG TPA: hypothetical protein HPP54_03375 [Nitrospinae bacterium]|nr:hypothetical protein [Nitrospinota bacterium]
MTGSITLATQESGGNAAVTNATVIDLAASSVGGNLTLTTGNALGITDSDTVTVGGNLSATTDANNGVINMVNLAVDGSISLTTDGTGNATVVNDAGLDFATSTVGGDLKATATTLNISDSGTLTVTGVTIISLGTNPSISVSGVTSATDLNGFTITLDTANNLFSGGITLRSGEEFLQVDIPNLDIDLARQVNFIELISGLDENTKTIYGGYNEHNIFSMYESFQTSMPKPTKIFKAIKKFLSNEPIISNKKESLIEEDENKEEDENEEEDENKEL